MPAPESYLSERRPPLAEALRAEAETEKEVRGKRMTYGEAIASLERKGYFTPMPRPWHLGFRDRGLGHGGFAVLDRFGDLVVEVLAREDAELIIAAVNAYES